MSLKIEYVKKEDLKPYVNNAKLHPAEQVEQIKNSIREFGFNDPIAVWKDNEIIEGHGRLLAAMEMNELETVPIIRLDHLNDKQRKAYMIAHNKLTMNSEFNIDLLSLEFEDLMDSFDMTDFGFNEAEILELTIDDSFDEIPSRNSYQQEEHDDHESYDGSQENNGGENPYPYVTKEDLKEYKERADELVTKRVIIVYKTDEDESFLKELLGIKSDEQLGVVYTIEKIKELSGR